MTEEVLQMIAKSVVTNVVTVIVKKPQCSDDFISYTADYLREMQRIHRATPTMSDIALLKSLKLVGSTGTLWPI